MSLFAELRRRNVFKVTTAYLALGWVVLESSGTVASVLRLPDWTSSLLFWLGLAGLPFVVVFAWVFELTPEGLKRESEIDRSQSITHATSKRLDYVIIGMLAVAIGLFLLQYFRPPVPPPVATSDAPVTQAVPVAEVTAPAPSAPALEPAPVTPDDKSIAVLPFADMSQAKDQEYFSDGMSEELLNLLAKAPDLKVIARTSSFAFRGKDVPIAEIARQLNVAHVLEGSVRKSGNTVRITAQLIRAADSTHLWSETYDRPLDDIFKVQDEIANAIVQALQVKLAGGELGRRRGGTQNFEAYQLVLRSNSAARGHTQSSLDTAGEYAEQAIKLDSNYGLAWRALAESILLKTDAGFLIPTQGYERARQLAQHLQEVSPDHPDGHAILAYVHLSLDWDWEAAEKEVQQALAIDPGYLHALNVAAMLAQILGRGDDAERLFHTAMARDPRNPYVPSNLAGSYYQTGRFIEADRTIRKVLALDRDLPGAHSLLALTLLAQSKPDEALAEAQKEKASEARLLSLPIFLQATGRQADADEALHAQIEQLANTCASCVAASYAYRGDHDRAFEWLERAYKQKDAAIADIIGDPVYKNIAHDPRFIAFLKKMNLPTEPVPVNWQ